MDFTPVTEEKRCPKCGDTKPVAAFSRDKTRKDGLQTRCKTCDVTANAAWQRANPEKVKAKHAAWGQANPEKIKANHAAWRQANPEKGAAKNRARKARKLRAIPGWADKAAITHLYDKAKEWSAILGIDLHVDHAIPLKSKFVCGLHTHDNLQLLEKLDNIRKGNRFWPDMPGEA